MSQSDCSVNFAPETVYNESTDLIKNMQVIQHILGWSHYIPCKQTVLGPEEFLNRISNILGWQSNNLRNNMDLTINATNNEHSKSKCTNQSISRNVCLYDSIFSNMDGFVASVINHLARMEEDNSDVSFLLDLNNNKDKKHSSSDESIKMLENELSLSSSSSETDIDMTKKCTFSSKDVQRKLRELNNFKRSFSPFDFKSPQKTSSPIYKPIIINRKRKANLKISRAWIRRAIDGTVRGYFRRYTRYYKSLMKSYVADLFKLQTSV